MPQSPEEHLLALKEIVINGTRNRRWTTEHIRNVARLMADTADEIDYANEMLSDALEAR